MRRFAFLAMTFLAMISISLIVLAQTSGPAARVSLRSRVQPFKGTQEWQEVSVEGQLQPKLTALVLCDMWDHHWCKGAEDRVGTLAAKMAPVIDRLRSRGVLVIHAPSETMEFYSDHPARLAMLRIPQVEPPQPLELAAPSLPIDDSDGGCDTPDNPLKPNTRVWTRENSAIRIVPGDLVSDKGQEVYSALHQRGIKDLLIAGVHTNMCVLNRGFAIKQMSKWGVRCVLIRDLTDAMYNPRRSPFVSHGEGTGLVIEYIEKYWAPTTTSTELLRALSALP
jgi:nicotinamidase-related amidase